MTSDEQQARRIIDGYIYRTTGMTPGHRFSNYINTTWGRIADIFRDALNKFTDPFYEYDKTHPKEDTYGGAA